MFLPPDVLGQLADEAAAVNTGPAAAAEAPRPRRPEAEAKAAAEAEAESSVPLWKQHGTF